MIPYLGCERARELLDGFVDGELLMADQVALESHLRWCRPCAARVEDMRLIGASLREAVPSLAPDDTRALAVIQSGVLTRIRAEHEQSLAVRIRAMFDDRRLLWPAVGATAALAACLVASLSVLQAATAENPESLAAMIDRLDRPPAPVLPPANPGSDQNPMRLDGRVSFPRALNSVSAFESMPEDEIAIALSAVVTREGRIGAYGLLQSERPRASRSRQGASDVDAVLDAVKHSRFAPAEAGGTKVAVNMVWLLVRPTARGTAGAETRVDARPVTPQAPSVEKPAELEVEPASVPSTDASTPRSTTA